MMKGLVRFALSLTIVSSVRGHLSPLSIKGSKFFLSNGTQFFIKGIQIFSPASFSLVSPKQCKVDAALAQSLGVNSVRFEAVGFQNHGECMKIYADAGIYVWAGLDGFAKDTNEGRDLMGKTPWSRSQMENMAHVIDEMHQYNNTAGFFVGNQLTGLLTYGHSYMAPFLKAAICDIKFYIKDRKYRSIPIGFEDNSPDPSNPPIVREYLTCPSPESGHPQRNMLDMDADFFAQSIIQDCHGSEQDASSKLATQIQYLSAQSSNSTIPVIMTDMVGNSCPNRSFNELDSLYTDQHYSLSGAFMQYDPTPPSHTDSRLVNYAEKYLIDQKPTEDPIKPTPMQPQFDNLKNKWAALRPFGVQKGAYTPVAPQPACPEHRSWLWAVNGSVPLPMADEKFDENLRRSWEKGGKAVASEGLASAQVRLRALVCGLLVGWMGLV